MTVFQNRVIFNAQSMAKFKLVQSEQIFGLDKIWCNSSFLVLCTSTAYAHS